MKDLVFVTGNIDKVTLLEQFLGYKVTHRDLDLPEIQSLDVKAIVYQKTLDAYKVLKKPVLVDDASLSINALGGLPGPLVKFFLKAVGGEGICRMVDGHDDRSATTSLLFGLYDGKDFYSFEAEVSGSISQSPRGNISKLTKMGWNPIFIPTGQDKTVAEMPESQLAEYTPRGHAAKKLAEFLKDRSNP